MALICLILAYFGVLCHLYQFENSQPKHVSLILKTMLIFPHTCPIYSYWFSGRGGRSIRWVYPGDSGSVGHSGVQTLEYPVWAVSIIS